MHEAQIFTHYLVNNKPPLCHFATLSSMLKSSIRPIRAEHRPKLETAGTGTCLVENNKV